MKLKCKETQVERVSRTRKWRKIFTIFPIKIHGYYYFLQYIAIRDVWSINEQVLCYTEYELLENV